jgi:hypothetical protein
MTAPPIGVSERRVERVLLKLVCDCPLLPFRTEQLLTACRAITRWRLEGLRDTWSRTNLPA